MAYFTVGFVVAFSLLIIYGYRKRIPPFRQPIVIFGFPILAALLLAPVIFH